MAGKLYLVATPIGNLGDITFRAVETLKSVDKILCEDTRTSLKLLDRYDIKKPLVAYHKFNYKTAIPKIIEGLLGGESYALISDAGMPCISDPGSEILPELRKNNIEYTIVPGACAFVSAVAVANIETPFTFVGFLPDNKKDERKLVESLKDYQTSLIFYVAPHKLLATIDVLYKILCNRDCASVREITKLHEEVEFFSLEQGYPKEPKGEYVLIVKPNKNGKQNDLLNLSVSEHYKFYINLGDSKNDAIKKVAKDRNVAKNVIYQQVINEKIDN